MLIQKKGASVWSTASTSTLLHTDIVVHYHLGFQGLINDVCLVLRLDVIHIGATLLFLFLLHRGHFSTVIGSGRSYIRGTACSQMVLSHHIITTWFIWTTTIVIILVDLTVIEAVAHVQSILIIVVYHTFSVSFTRLSQLVLIVSTMALTTSIDNLFWMLIGVGSICLRDYNALHKVIVLWYHAALIRSVSITWISNLLLARLVLCFARHSTWANASTGVIVVVNAFHVLGNDVIFTLILWSMRSWFTLKTRIWLSGRVILLVNITVECIMVRRVTTKPIYIVQAYLGLMQ